MHLRRLREIDGCRFYSLQKGSPAAELVTDRGLDPVVDLAPRLDTFADTAAAVEALDLIISVDTAVVHLAGALAKPVWTLVAIPGDWRWLEHRDDSPWYPTMRLFRQRRPGAWDEVIARLTSALAKAVDDHQKFGRIDAASAAPAVSTTMDTPAREDNEVLCRVAETRAGIMMYAPADTLTASAISFYGECRHAELESLLALLAPDMVAMEVAAGVGVHAVPIAAALGANGHLFLYENDAFLKQVLNENLRANRIANVTIMRHGLDTAAGGARESIDDLRLERLQLLKINERADALAVLEGAHATLTRLRPHVFVEVAGDDKIAPLVSALRTRSYACWRREFPLFNPANFNARDVDLFAGRNSLAIVGIPAELSFDVGHGWERLA